MFFSQATFPRHGSIGEKTADSTNRAEHREEQEA